MPKNQSDGVELTSDDGSAADGTTGASRLVGSDRVLAVLRELARFPNGVGLDEITRVVGSPKPTVHRALQSLRRAGFADQDERSQYVLGDEFLRLAFAHHDIRPEQMRIRPVLETLATAFGETAHYAVLDGREVVYRAKVDAPSGAVRLTSTIGGRNPAHCTAVGKLLLAHKLRTEDDVAAWVAQGELVRRTDSTKCSVSELYDEITAAREVGFATEDQENEIGVSCLAVPVYGLVPGLPPGMPSGAVSVSALSYRTSLDELVHGVGEFVRAVGIHGEPQ